MNPPLRNQQPSNLEAFITWVRQQSPEDQASLIKVAFEDQQLRDFERTFESLGLEQRQDIFQRLGLADHLIKRIPSPESESASPAAGGPPSQPTVATTAPEVEVVSPQVPVAAAPVDPSRFSKHVGPIVAGLALIGVIGGAMVHFGPTAVSGSSGNDNGASSLDGTALVDQGLEGEPPVIEQVTLRATGPSWVTLRREGRVVFDGSLEGEKVVNQPADVEIYAGRPDLVEVSAEGLSARMVGTIDDLRWLPLLP